jgi:sugar/nucleoside kinase (ribokinase family)
MQKVLGMGNALVDIMTRIENDEVLDELQLPKGSMQLIDKKAMGTIMQKISSFKTESSSGGSAANTVHGLANLGIGTAFIGKTGNDEFGTFFRNDLMKSNIGAKLLKSETDTGRAIALISPDSERTFATFLGAAAELTHEDLYSEMFQGFSYFHIEGYLVQNHDLIKKAVELAGKNNLKVSLDLASYNVVEANLEFLKSLAGNYVDIIFANEEEARAFTGREAREALAIIGKLAEIAVVKTGKNGSLVYHNGEICEVAAIPAKPVDTTGAGDLYAAGFLYGLINERPPDQCGFAGSLLAGKVIEVVGAKIRPDDWKEINKILQ